MSFTHLIHGFGKEHEIILQWWKLVSVQKPLRCQMDSSYLKPDHPLVTNLTSSWNIFKTITSRPCHYLDVTYLVHTFRGKTVDNKFEGKDSDKIENRCVVCRWVTRVYRITFSYFTVKPCILQLDKSIHDLKSLSLKVARNSRIIWRKEFMEWSIRIH